MLGAAAREAVEQDTPVARQRDREARIPVVVPGAPRRPPGDNAAAVIFGGDVRFADVLEARQKALNFFG